MGFLTPLYAETPTVSGLRLGQTGDATRFVFDSTTPLSPTIFTLDDPFRVVIDLPEVKFDVPTGTGRQSKGLIQGFRFGLFRTGLSRVVLDVSGPVKIARKFVLPPTADKPGSRLVIDLAKTDLQEFRENSGWPQSSRPTATAPTDPGQTSAYQGPQPNLRPQPVIKPIVVIDPGHGGVDPGAHGRRTGKEEKDIVLDVAKRVRNHLQRGNKVEPRLTRDRDIFIKLPDRVRRARAMNGDLFVSIHADAAENPKARGAGVYTLSEKSSDREAAALARRENRADMIAGVDLSGESNEVTSILIDLTQRETMNSSVLFAQMLTKSLAKAAPLRSNTHRFAGFRVLKAPDIPSVLIELGFLTNREEENRLVQPAQREKLAIAIARAIEDYLAGPG
ncbi:MAG: N-acetylmuramoyl-L-alanine amidase [Alphaproteobacteria bacterium]